MKHIFSPMMNDPFSVPMAPPPPPPFHQHNPVRLDEFSPQRKFDRVSALETRSLKISAPGTPQSPRRICPNSPFPPPLFPGPVPQSPIMPPGPFPMPVPAPPPQQPRPLPMNNVPAVHIVTVILPGLSAFTGYGNNYNKAKANAATQVEQTWKLESEVEF